MARGQWKTPDTDFHILIITVALGKITQALTSVICSCLSNFFKNSKNKWMEKIGNKKKTKFLSLSYCWCKRRTTFNENVENEIIDNVGKLTNGLPHARKVEPPDTWINISLLIVSSWISYDLLPVKYQQQWWWVWWR